MAIFSPDTVFFGDRIGFGYWLDSHYLEHQQFVAIGFASHPVFFIPDYNLLPWTWEDKKAQTDWFDAHQDVHDALRDGTGVQGFDLSVVDFDNPAYFSLWIDAHAAEHAEIRQALGLF